jgi:hypothetical protein
MSNIQNILSKGSLPGDSAINLDITQGFIVRTNSGYPPAKTPGELDIQEKIT